MRVIPVVGIMLAGKDRITPACAGNTLRMVAISAFAVGSPPHVRVILEEGNDRFYLSGITPACAGNTLTLRKSISRMLGSPPHVRVILFKKFKASSVERITPACAGNTDMF